MYSTKRRKYTTYFHKLFFSFICFTTCFSNYFFICLKMGAFGCSIFELYFLINSFSWEFVIHLHKKIISDMRLYLDNCCFNRPFDDQSQLKVRLETEAKLFIQQGILVGRHELVWSYILDFENRQNPYINRYSAINDWKSIANIHCVETEDIILFAESLFSSGIKVKDALHISCAVHSNADYFITTDKKLLNTTIQEIKIINPLMFINN